MHLISTTVFQLWQAGKSWKLRSWKAGVLSWKAANFKVAAGTVAGRRKAGSKSEGVMK